MYIRRYLYSTLGIHKLTTFVLDQPPFDITTDGSWGSSAVFRLLTMIGRVQEARCALSCISLQPGLVYWTILQRRSFLCQAGMQRRACMGIRPPSKFRSWPSQSFQSTSDTENVDSKLPGVEIGPISPCIERIRPFSIGLMPLVICLVGSAGRSHVTCDCLEGVQTLHCRGFCEVPHLTVSRKVCRESLSFTRLTSPTSGLSTLRRCRRR